MNKFFKGQRYLPLNFVLVIPFLLEIFVAVGLTGFFSLRNGQRAVRELAGQVQQEIGSLLRDFSTNVCVDTISWLRQGP